MRPRHVFPLFALLALAMPASAEETTDAWAAWTRARAEKLEKNGEYEDAIEEWLALAQLRPKDVEPLSNAAVLSVEMPSWRGKELAPGTPEFHVAQRCVRDAVSRWGRGDPGIAYAVGRLHYAEKHWGPAWQTLGDAVMAGFDPVRSRLWFYRAAVQRANNLVDMHRGAEVVEDLEALRKSQPGHPEERYLLINLAAANRDIQQPAVATKILDEELAKNPGDADALYLMGKILADEGRLEEAEKRFRETMLHASAAYGDQTYRNALLRLCEVYVKLNRLDDAERAADQYVALAKDDADGLFAQGRVALAKNDLDRAVRLLRRAARLTPRAFDTLVELQKTLYRLGETAEADEVGKRIEEVKRQDDPTAPGMMQSAPKR